MDWMNEMELRQTGCIYQHRGVMCKDKTKCSVCGWNPQVEQKRKEAIKQQREESDMGWGVHDYPEPPPGWWDEHGGTSYDEEADRAVDEWEEFELYEDDDEYDHDEYDDESFP